MQHRQLKEEVVAANFAPEEFEENKQPPALRGAFEAVKVDAKYDKNHRQGYYGQNSMNGNGDYCDGGELFNYSLLGDSLF